jgi:hypothetical protein
MKRERDTLDHITMFAMYAGFGFLIPMVIVHWTIDPINPMTYMPFAGLVGLVAGCFSIEKGN